MGDTDAAIQGKTIKELRQIIDAAGLRHDDCLEKVDLRKRALEALRRGRGSKNDGSGAKPPDPAPIPSGPPPHRQLRVTWRDVLVHMAPKHRSDGLAILTPGALVMTTGRREGRWLEVKFPIGRKGWVLPEVSPGPALLLGVEERGRHGDSLDIGGPDLLWKLHDRSLLTMDSLPKREDLNSRWVASAGAANLKLVVERDGDVAIGKEAGDTDDLKFRALKALQAVLPEPGDVKIERYGHNAHLLTPVVLAPGKPLPLLVVLHGAGKTEQVIKAMVNGLRATAESAEVLVLVAAARNHTWDYIFNGQRDDVDFLEFAVNEVRRRYCVDDGCIALLGYSDGASMGLTLALNNPQIFQAAMCWAAGFFSVEPSLLPAGSLKPRLLLEYGSHDDLFPFEKVAVRNRNVLQKLGYDFVFNVDHGGHHHPRPEFTRYALKFWLGRDVQPEGPQSQFTQPHYAKGRELQFEFEREWQRLFGTLLPAEASAELKWLVWNELWRAANTTYAAQVGSEKHEEKIRKAAEDGARVKQHLQVLRALTSLDAAAVQCLCEQAASAGDAAAAAALRGSPLTPEHVDATAAPEVQGCFPPWPPVMDAVKMAARAVAEMLLDEYAGPPLGRPHLNLGRELQEKFKQLWLQHCAVALASMAGLDDGPQPLPPEDLEDFEAVSVDLQELVWCEVQHAAASECLVLQRGERVSELRRQADRRLAALQVAGLPDEVLQILAEQAVVAGRAAAHWAMGGQAPSEDLALESAPPGQMSPEAWCQLLVAIQTAAAASTEFLLDETTEQPAVEAAAPADPAPALDLALGRPSASSSDKSGERAASNAFDGRADTRWTSAYSDGQWLSVDLCSTRAVSRIDIRWERAHARNYSLEGSVDGSTWEVFASEAGKEGWVITKLPPGSKARWFRMHGQDRATEYGFSIWEMKIYGI